MERGFSLCPLEEVCIAHEDEAATPQINYYYYYYYFIIIHLNEFVAKKATPTHETNLLAQGDIISGEFLLTVA